MFSFRFTNSWDRDNYEIFILCRSYPISKTRLADCGSFNTCREFFTKNMRPLVSKDDPVTHKAYVLITTGRANNKASQEARRLRMVEKANKAVFLLNLFEKHHKWPLTKAYPALEERYNIPFMFFVGSKKWTRSVYNMSLWTLMIKTGFTKNLLKVKDKEIDSETVVSYLKSRCRSSMGLDAQIKATVDHWHTYMKVNDALYREHPRKFYWDANRLTSTGFIRSEGIVKLISKAGGTYYHDLRDHYLKLMVKEAKASGKKKVHTRRKGQDV